MRNGQKRLPARRWLAWPAAAVCLIGIGGIAALDLSRTNRPVAAFALAMAITALAGAATTLLVTRLIAAQRAALRDGLTGLPNRALLDDRVAQALARSRRTGEPFALLIVDLDGFKGVNDIRGTAGNEVLRTIARRLESVIRETDTVARASAATSSSSSRSGPTAMTKRLRSPGGFGRPCGGRTGSAVPSSSSTPLSVGRSSRTTVSRPPTSSRVRTGRCTRPSATPARNR